MKVELLVSEWCASCHEAERIWRQVAEEKDIDFQVVDMAQPEGRELATRLRVRSIPALVIDGELKGVGVQTLEEARALVASAPPKRATTIRHVGLGLARSGRIMILAAMGYLVLAGGAMTWAGGLFIDAPQRPAVIHLFTVGFVLLLIYALAEHMLPRFTGLPIRAGAWPWLQQGLTHLGLWAFLAGFLGAGRGWALAGAGLMWLGLLLFALRIFPLLTGKEMDRA